MVKIYIFTNDTIQWISQNNFKNGILNLYSAYKCLINCTRKCRSGCKNRSLNYFDILAPMDNTLYIHTTEGIDDLPAHIKSALTNNQISLSIKGSKLLLGTWQGLYLFEHRLEKQNRTIIHHFIGE